MMGKVGSTCNFSLNELVFSEQTFKDEEVLFYTADEEMVMWVSVSTPGGSDYAFASIAHVDAGGRTHTVATNKCPKDTNYGSSYASASGAVHLMKGEKVKVERNKEAEYWTTVTVLASKKVEFM